MYCKWYSLTVWICIDKSLSNMRTKVTAVSMTPLCKSQRCQWHRCAVCSRVRFPYKKNSVPNYSRRYSKKKLVAQRCQWHCWATNFVDYLREFKAIFKKALTCVKLFHEKNRGRKSRVRVPLTRPKNVHSKYLANKEMENTYLFCLHWKRNMFSLKKRIVSRDFEGLFYFIVQSFFATSIRNSKKNLDPRYAGILYVGLTHRHLTI
jgi:hypothetical protein